MAVISLTRELFVKKVSPLIYHSSEFRFLGEKPAVLDFYAEWCSPCQMVAPVLEELSDLFDGKVDFYKINVDEENELSAHFNIRSIPSVQYLNFSKYMNWLINLLLLLQYCNCFI